MANFNLLISPTSNPKWFEMVDWLTDHLGNVGSRWNYNGKTFTFVDEKDSTWFYLNWSDHCNDLERTVQYGDQCVVSFWVRENGKQWRKVSKKINASVVGIREEFEFTNCEISNVTLESGNIPTEFIPTCSNNYQD